VIVGEQEQTQHLAIFEALMAGKIAREAARMADERIREFC
jgi:hypothetical protein